MDCPQDGARHRRRGARDLVCLAWRALFLFLAAGCSDRSTPEPPPPPEVPMPAAPQPGAMPGQPGMPQPGAMPGQPAAPYPGAVPGQPAAPYPGAVPGQPAAPGAPATMPVAAGAATFYCFDVVFPDGGRNSECVRDMARCTADLVSMRGYTHPGAVFNGCYPTSTAFCYDGTGELCFTQLPDCEASRGTIPGGPCMMRS